MNKVDGMLKLLGVEFNEIFELIDSNKKVVGKYVFEQVKNGFVLKNQNSKTGQWCIKGNQALGDLLVNIINDVHKLKSLNCKLAKEFKPLKFRRPKKGKELPIYIEDVVVNKEEDTLTVHYINQNEEKKTKTLQSHESESGKLYCRFGYSGTRLYFDYKGPLILLGIPMEEHSEIKSIISKYGTITQ